jgi:CheY-like chemotaxis protein
MQTILIADDDAGDLDLVKLLFRLSKISNPIQTACNGDQVIDYLNGRGIYSDRSKFPYPLLCLLDLRMPRRNGYEVLSWLNNHPEQSVKVVVLTATRSEDLARTDSLGGYPFLEKPFSFMKFQELIAKHPDLILQPVDGNFCLRPNHPEPKGRCVAMEAATC